MDIKWGNLGSVFGASLGITIAVVVMFSLGVAAWGRAGSGPRDGQPRDGQEKAALAVAAVCFAACLAVAAYGIDLLVPG
ncbi:hypothetical protein [Actinacidiphila glaucinigra]|uniref:Uncharacterized protein n=1 Tax=Actinacidiphila glaucinigra TaxID=235986 RepID=A0A239LLB2_9ACTN|nr:hypothetical protein [Actinacidiphila glaucinigra]SNT31356.1 hypothetical protein SAMN05216252_12097 [Actinacidiphila glaucinigra]